MSSKEESLYESVRKAGFVIGGGLVTFVAARNSITWHAQRFWGASGDFWQAQWDKIYDIFGEDEFTIGVYGSYMLTVGLFWFLNLAFIFIETTGIPKFALNYKVQETKKASLADLKKASIRVFFNHTVIGLPMVLISYWIMKMRGCSFGRALPTFHWVVFEMFVFIWVEEIGFYYSHRLMHSPPFYKRIHKIHHEWTAPIGIVSMYAHPIEHIVSNLLPVMMGPIICGSHIGTSWLWYSLAIFSTIISHCGYHFPLLPSPEAHDFHHLKFNNNFGVLGVLDRLHGTDASFRQTTEYKRHFLSLSLIPVKTMFPEKGKSCKD